MAMSDQEKIAWFDQTMDWVDQWGSSIAASETIDYCSDPAINLFLDTVAQYKKDRGK